MKRRLFCFLFAIMMGLFAPAQEKEEAVLDTSFAEEDYDLLFSELDSLIDSLMKPRSFWIANLSVGSNVFNFPSRAGYSLESRQQLSYTPSLGYYSKSGLGLNTSVLVVHDGERLNPYSLQLTGSYDYVKSKKFVAGISATRIFTKDSLPFYTSPLRNELYGYFTYRKSWLRPTLALSYGWGKRSDVVERERYLTTLRLRRRGVTRIHTEEAVSDFSLITSVRHDFYKMDVFSSKDYLRFTPQLVLTSGTQRFGFNQTTNTYARIPRTGTNVLFSSGNVNLDDATNFRVQSSTLFLKTEYAIGKFYLQPQFILDYYFPAEDKNLTTAFVVNAGLIF